MKYCEILFDLENIFDILIRAASWQNISSLRINTNNDEWYFGCRPKWYSGRLYRSTATFTRQQIIHYLGLDQPVHMRIVNEIFPVPDQQLMISMFIKKYTKQQEHWPDCAFAKANQTFAYFLARPDEVQEELYCTTPGVGVGVGVGGGVSKKFNVKVFMWWVRRCQASYPVPVTGLVSHGAAQFNIGGDTKE